MFTLKHLNFNPSELGFGLLFGRIASARWLGVCAAFNAASLHVGQTATVF